MSSTDSELSDSDIELQEAFVEGKLKPGLNIVQKQQPKQVVNNVAGLKQKLGEFQTKLPWIEFLDCVSKQAPLAPELAAQLQIQEDKRQNQIKNNKKLAQFSPSDDPVLNDFKREMIFHRQAQATVIEALPKLKKLGMETKRPDDYFAEMAKTDEHMQKIREHLMKKQVQQQKSERVKQLRQQRKEGKMLQVLAKLEKQKQKKNVLEQIKKVRKGQAKDFDFLDKKSKKAMEKKKFKDHKYGFGGKKKRSKWNTKDSAADISEFKQPSKPGRKRVQKGKVGQKRPGKNRRIQNKNKRK